jgi:hypothetical protein
MFPAGPDNSASRMLLPRFRPSLIAGCSPEPRPRYLRRRNQKSPRRHLLVERPALHPPQIVASTELFGTLLILAFIGAALGVLYFMNLASENNPYVKGFFSRKALGRKPAFSPLLLISGETDGDVPSSLTAAIVSRLCQQKDHVLLINYPGLNASSVLGNSVGEQLSWIRARFSSRPAPSNCH